MGWETKRLVSPQWMNEWARWAHWWDERGYPLGAIDYYTITDPQKMRWYYDPWRAFLKEKGWLDKVYINTPVDEADDQDPSAEETVIRWAQTMRQIAPELKLHVNLTASDLAPKPKPAFGRWRASKGLKAYEGLIDWWLQSPGQFTDEATREFFMKQKARGCRLGWYLQQDCLCAQSAVYHRSFFWRMMKYEIDFFIVYRVNAWHNIERREDDATFYWKSGGYPAGMGLLLWPGPDNRCYPSLRFEIIRDGIEDHEYFALLQSWHRTLSRQTGPQSEKDMAAISKLLSQLDDVVASAVKASSDESRYIAIRRQWGRMLEHLARTYPSTELRPDISQGEP